MVGRRFNENKLKPNLKMAMTRIQLATNKKVNTIKLQKREIAGYLLEGKEEKARIRVEAIIRDDNAIEAYEILELMCDLLSERIAFISASEDCPAELKQAVHTLIWAATRVDIPELDEVKKQFRAFCGG